MSARGEKHCKPLRMTHYYANKLLQMGEPMCDEEAEEIIGYVDKNGDGKIDIDEFITMMLKCIAEEEELEHDDD